METNRNKNAVLLALAITLWAVIPGPAESASVKGGYLYTLSNFTGPIPYDRSRLTADKDRNEIYVLYQNSVRLFNESGMEIYQFGDDLGLGQILDTAVDEHGDILLLAYEDSRGQIVRCNYRGEPKSRIELKNVPGDLYGFFSDFSPNRMVYQGGNIYLLSQMGMKIVVADREGNFKKGFDLIALLDLEENDRGNTEVRGFSVDKDGNILMTIPVLFSAYILSPDGKIRSFGRPGSAPGKFNIATGIVRDGRGNYLVVDALKAAVMVFDKGFNFVTQFGSYGYKPGKLVFPEDIIIDNRDRAYVTQAGKRGVSVFQLTYN